MSRNYCLSSEEKNVSLFEYRSFNEKNHKIRWTHQGSSKYFSSKILYTVNPKYKSSFSTPSPFINHLFYPTATIIIIVCIYVNAHTYACKYICGSQSSTYILKSTFQSSRNNSGLGMKFSDRRFA